MKKIALALMAVLVASPVFAQSPAPAQPTPTPGPTVVPVPIPVPGPKLAFRGIIMGSDKCPGNICKFACNADEVMVVAVCNNHLGRDGTKNMPELMPKYHDHRTAECPANTADSMYAICGQPNLFSPALRGN